ncbi:ShlB/FhaC/HecB family hemolysin secretion/activation protein [Burkholderia sp. PU8-34]
MPLLGYRFKHFPLTMLLLAPAVLAQPVPDAGRLLEENRPAPSLPEREAPKIEIQEPPVREAQGGARIPVTHFEITGALQFAESDLRALVADGEGKELSLDQLQELAARITRYYRTRGYLLARAYLPAQDVKAGVVEIAVVEGRLGEVKVDNAAGAGGASLAPLTRLHAGEVVRDRPLEESLLLLSDVPGIEVKSTLRPGATVGTSDLLVDVAPGPRISGDAEVDTYGDRYSGQLRGGGTININNPFQLGDQATFRALTSGRGMVYGRGSYQLPINAFGTRVGIAASDMHYHLGNKLSQLDASGNAEIGSLYLQQPFVRSRTFNLYGQLQYDHLKLKDRIGIVDTELHKGLNNWTVGLSGDSQDSLAGGAINSFSLSYTTGNLSLDGVTRALDDVSAHTAGRFGRWNTSWLRLQRIADRFSLYVSAMAQFASKNLDSSEKFSLGGANGVRAYPQGEAPGDQGYLATVEARYLVPLPLPGIWQVAAFIDRGHVRVNKEPWTASSNTRTLTGAGIGLNVNEGRDWAIKMSVAWRLHSDPPTSDSDRSPRAWVQATKYF